MDKVDAGEPRPIKDRIRNVSVEVIRDFKEKGINPLENAKVYDLLEQMPKNYRDAILTKGDQGKKKLIETSLGEKFSVCIFHPGIQARLTEFIAFCKTQLADNQTLSPHQVLSLFSSSLGNRIVYRGMALTPTEAKEIQQFGIMAPAIRGDDAPLALEALLSDEKMNTNSHYPVSFAGDIARRVGRFGGSSISCSISTNEIIANSAGWYSSDRTKTKGVAPYVYTVSIPVLLTYTSEAIYNDYRGPTTLWFRRGMFGWFGRKTRFGRNDIELFIPFGITRQQIIEGRSTKIPRRLKGEA